MDLLSLDKRYAVKIYCDVISKSLFLSSPIWIRPSMPSTLKTMQTLLSVRGFRSVASCWQLLLQHTYFYLHSQISSISHCYSVLSIVCICVLLLFSTDPCVASLSTVPHLISMDGCRKIPQQLGGIFESD